MEPKLTDKQKLIFNKMIEIHPKQFGVWHAIELFEWKSMFGGDLSKKFRLPFYKIMSTLEKNKIVYREFHNEHSGRRACRVYDDFLLTPKYQPKK